MRLQVSQSKGGFPARSTQKHFTDPRWAIQWGYRDMWPGAILEATLVVLLHAVVVVCS